MFNCRKIGDAHYLRNDPGFECYTPQHNLYCRIAVFWTFFYVAGVPVLNVALLWSYGIPSLACKLQRDALLRSLLLHAHHTDVSRHTCESITDEHVEIIYSTFFAAKSPMLTRDEKLTQLLTFAREQLTSTVATWQQGGDESIKPAKEAIGHLFSEFNVNAWFWSLVEVLNKLIITSVLGFIAPGTQGQVAAGLGVTFLMLLAYQHARPYRENAYYQIGHAAAVELFLFFVFALMLKADVQVIPRNNDDFYSFAVGLLFCSVFALPVFIIARRLRWQLQEVVMEDGHKLKAEEAPMEEELCSNALAHANLTLQTDSQTGLNETNAA